jgi:hypothetical protein
MAIGISKRIYELIQNKMEQLPEHSEISASLKLKPWKDFLDTDIIQEITFGYPYGGMRNRVVVLTFDNAQALGHRAQLHRQVGLTLAKKCEPDLLANTLSPFLTHPGGCVVQCDKTGAIVSILDMKARFLALRDS